MYYCPFGDRTLLTVHKYEYDVYYVPMTASQGIPENLMTISLTPEVVFSLPNQLGPSSIII